MTKRDLPKHGGEVDSKNKENNEYCIKSKSKKSKSGNMRNSERWLIDTRTKTRRKSKSQKNQAITIHSNRKKVLIHTILQQKARRQVSALLKNKAKAWVKNHKTRRTIWVKVKHNKDLLSKRPNIPKYKLSHLNLSKWQKKYKKWQKKYSKYHKRILQGTLMNWTEFSFCSRIKDFKEP